MHAALKHSGALSICALAAAVAVAVDSPAKQAPDKYTAKVPGGLAFSEFKGYESWQAISVSHNEKAAVLILGNPMMIEAFQAGIPDNGKPFPDGSKMAKIHWHPKRNAYFTEVTVPGTQRDVDFMVKDGKRFADSGGWEHLNTAALATERTGVRSSRGCLGRRIFARSCAKPLEPATPPIKSSGARFEEATVARATIPHGSGVLR